MARRKTIADAEAAEAARFLEGAVEIGPLDPVDAAIAAHRSAWTKMVALYDATKTSKPRYKAVEAMKAYEKVYDELTDIFVRTQLTTLAQITAFADYVGDLPDCERGEWDCPRVADCWQYSNAMGAVADALLHLQAAPVPNTIGVAIRPWLRAA